MTPTASISGTPALADLHVVLVTPEIAWNAGNTGRTCLAAGAQLHLVRPLGFSLDGREVRRAGVDYWPRVQPVVWEDWDALEAALPTIGEPFFFSAEAPREIWDVRFPSRSVLVFGRESGGLPEDLNGPALDLSMEGKARAEPGHIVHRGGWQEP